MQPAIVLVSIGTRPEAVKLALLVRKRPTVLGARAGLGDVS